MELGYMIRNSQRINKEVLKKLKFTRTGIEVVLEMLTFLPVIPTELIKTSPLDKFCLKGMISLCQLWFSYGI